MNIITNDLKPIRLGGIFDKPGLPHQAGAIWDKNGISPTIDTMQRGYRQPLVVEGGNAEVKIAIGKIDSEKINVIGNYMPSGHDASRIVHPDGVAPTVKENHGTVTATIQKSKAINTQDGLCRTIKAQYQQTSRANLCRQGTFGATGVTNGCRIRKLTPKECWRLMGFDDVDFDKAEKVCSNSQLYKQAGNSIVVNVLEGILGNLLPKQSRSEWLDELLAGD